ncbi:MAG: ABC transporter transmembrane domain-containing protein [Rhodospirillales bacterium]|nr:ABC transporter transmembrane domain-containing protein [Rhodospirillales bacterium]MDE0378717.1 ABC transporter transmembrane domain-containing protein [Rhodospirillales bacterium]
MEGPESSQPPGSTRQLLVRLVREHVRPHLGRLVLAVFCMVLAAGATAALAYLMEPVLDEIFLEKDRTLLIVVPVAVIVITLIRGVATYGQAVLMAFVGQRVIADLQSRVFAHILRFDLAFFQDTASGRLVSRLTNDVNMMRNAVANALTGMVKDSLTLLFLVGVMFEKDWKLALIACVVFPIAVYPIAKLGRRMRRVSTSALNELGLFTARLNEAFQGARHVKAYRREDFEAEKTDRLIESVFRLIFKSHRIRAIASPLMETLGGIFVAVLILYGGWQVIEGALTPGAFFAFVTAMLLAYRPLKALANLNNSLQEGLAASQRVFDLLDTEPRIVEAPAARPLRVAGGAVALERVRFTYPNGVPALHDLSLDIPAGETVALVGPSGAGKSTVLNLIPRFYDVEEGAVRIDGLDVREATIGSVRDAVALVSQEAVLFDDSVRANIAYGRIEAGEQEIVAAARAAGADGFIRELPAGYDTVIGEHGVKLSGGQRQRLSIARAMLKDAPILLLDEATSALDAEAERQVQEALRGLMQGRTTLMIAHRLSTVQDANRIYVLEGGRLAESGTHRSLLAAGGVYARLHAMQFAADMAAE